MNTDVHMRDIRPGVVVQVKSEEEIRASLDSRGTLQRMPFMPEMLKFCGERFQVTGWAHKTCVEGYGIRALGDSVFLGDLRCDGLAHDGCQRGCLLFWRTEWLKQPDGGEQERGSTVARSSGAPPATWETRDGNRYVCQSTELFKATRPLPWWNIRQYLDDILSGQLSLSSFVTGMGPLLIAKMIRVAGRGESRFLRGVKLKTPSTSLQLVPGELVRTRPQEEIRETLDRQGKNRGLEFSSEMTAFCDKSYRVKARVDRGILEQTGELREFKETVSLEGAVCDGAARRWCPRKNYLFWREIWLERKEP